MVFDFRMGRELEGPKRSLGNYEGVLQPHARRKSFEAVKLSPKDRTSIRIVPQMGELFAIE
jgi:hypothetical protein